MWNLPDTIEVVTLARGAEKTHGAWVEGAGHRVHAPWPAAEAEVKRRCLRSLADRTVPPDGVAFVRQWADQTSTHPPEHANFPCVLPTFERERDAEEAAKSCADNWRDPGPGVPGVAQESAPHPPADALAKFPPPPRKPRRGR